MAIRCIDLASLWMQGRDANCNFRYPVGSNAHRGAGAGDLCSGGGRCRLGVARTSEDAGRPEVGACGIFEPDSRDTVWNAAGLSEAEYVVAPSKEKTGPQARASGEPAPAGGAGRPACRASCRHLSEVRRAIVPLPGNSDTLCRRYSSRPTGGYRTCDSSRLVPRLPREGRAGRCRRSAGLHIGKSGAGAQRLAALCTGQHALANRRSLQLPSADETQPWWTAADVVSAGGNSSPLVRADSPRGPGFGRAARRRKRLASEWKNALAVVLCQYVFELFHDRPLPRLAGVAEVFQRRIWRDAGERLLGRLQRGRLRAAADVPGAPVARPGARREVQIAWCRLASVCEATPTAAGRRHSAVAAERRIFGRDVRLAPTTDRCTPPNAHRHILEMHSSATIDQTLATTSRRLVYVPGPTRRPLRKQPRRTFHSPGGDHSQKLLRQPQ